MNIFTLPNPELDEKIDTEGRWQKYKDIFPFENPYPVQKTAIALIDYMIERGVKYFVLQSPVGTGKTVSMVTVARKWVKTTHVSGVLNVDKKVLNVDKKSYDILGVDVNVTEVELKIAYRKKALEYHPDRNMAEIGDDVLKKKEFERKFIEIQNAYETIKGLDLSSDFEEALSSFDGYNGFYYLTPKIGLANQVKKDFSEIKDVKGRSNFSCVIEDTTCDNALCVLDKDFKCKRKKDCLYYMQRNLAAVSPEVVSNPAYMNRVLLSKNSIFCQRKIAVWDEAHRLEEHFISMGQSQITDWDYEFVQRIRGVGKKDVNYEDINMNIREDDYEYIVQEIVNFYSLWQKALVEYAMGRSTDLKELNRLLSIGERIKGILHNFQVKKDIKTSVKVPKHGDVTIYRYYPNKYNPRNASVSFEYTKRTKKWVISPVIVGHVARRFIDDTAEINLFMSATIVDFIQFSKGIGIPISSEETIGINIDESPFDEDRRLIYHTPAGLMNRGKIDETLPLLAEKIEAIIKQNHMGQRGIILPYTHRIRKYLVDYLKDIFPGRILTHGSELDRTECPYCEYKLKGGILDENDRLKCPRCEKMFFNNMRSAVINRFITEKDKPYILISTYINEGYDLKDDIARFAIICKIPYPNLGDGNIRKRIMIEQDMYREATGYSCDCWAEDIADQVDGREVRYTVDVCNNNYECGRCKGWYNMKTVAPLIQMTGRVVRNKNDWASVYIMDQGFKGFVRRHSYLFPSYFIKSIRWFDK